MLPIPNEIQMSTRRRRRQYVALGTSQHGHHISTPVIVSFRDDAPHAESTLNPLVLPNIGHEEVFRAGREARQVFCHEMRPSDFGTSQQRG